MILVLSPAKRLDYERPVPPEVAALATRPQYLDDAAALIEVMRGKTPVQVEGMGEWRPLELLGELAKRGPIPIPPPLVPKPTFGFKRPGQR